MLFFLVDPTRGDLRPRLTLGGGADALARSLLLGSGSGGNVIAAAMAAKEPVFLSVDDPEGELVATLGAAELGVAPLVVGGRAIGSLYCDRKTAAGRRDAASLIFLGRVQAMAEQPIARRAP